MANRRVKVIIEGYYEILPELYPLTCKTDLDRMNVDKNNPNLDEHTIVESLEDVKVTFKLIKEKANA